jgi:hypothetical protein
VTEPPNNPALDYATPDRRRDPRWLPVLVVTGITLGLMVIVGIVIHWLRKSM